ncbi:hypothetical protein [Synechococcus sp. UW140]|uniref:hypothetical protein n=1 Tax=Synechococcus sp. UW140 TaxID=368503 RepID=UPI001A7E0ED8|nr:hypothetical protein [Synechococcus sp. UW140]
MSTYILIALFCVWIPCGLLSTAIADSKNHPSWLWLLAGSIFGPIGLAGAVSLKEKIATNATMELNPAKNN